MSYNNRETGMEVPNIGVERLVLEDNFKALLEIIKLKEHFSPLAFAVLIETMTRQLMNFGFSQQTIDAGLDRNGIHLDTMDA